MEDSFFNELIGFMKKIPGIDGSIGKGVFENNNWWIKFSINIDHQLAWQVVQEIGFVANYLSIEERLPTVFYPISPPPLFKWRPKRLSFMGNRIQDF